ncbi:YjjG family noncanonical pyrimidine nucleotidase [Niabella ginsengisoli]|uniref:YjjG family noncanonical pyrimidine nucleotidase n=1 Tax=Niabella ginsengisoli TaxID=522298 RepID=A0ABS9SNZ9_9BACT|nr:YjjG family noncanonical pyrimidine nucleotidase [Niabella ginsengisoli]MCH5600090.1 YjjG family noncanonical pyrimidine nucleotidase [Niabella ginsengisoli]
MKYKHLFFDLDHTLWDFDSNAKITLLDLYTTLELEARGVHDFDLFYRNYLAHNLKLWARYRNGFIKQAELRVKRMRLALLDFKIADDVLAETMSVRFLEMLPTRNVLFPHTIEILEYLHKKNYKLHLITNGFEEVQHHKITNSKIKHYFDKVITSEGSNSLKPKKEIFDYALHATKASIHESIMLGDDLEADIIGAYKAGMDQVFINHIDAEHDFKPTYMVRHLKELEDIF